MAVAFTSLRVIYFKRQQHAVYSYQFASLLVISFKAYPIANLYFFAVYIYLLWLVSLRVSVR